jgi:hypothetical protein
MAWQTIMVGNSLSEFEAAQPTIDDLPPGTPFRIVINAILIAPIANIMGAEWVAQQFLDNEAEVTNVYSEGDNIIVEAVAIGVAPLIIAAIIIAALFAIAYLIRSIKMDANLPSGGGWTGNLATIVKWGAIGVLGFLAFKLVSDLRNTKEVSKT